MYEHTIIYAPFDARIVNIRIEVTECCPLDKITFEISDQPVVGTAALDHPVKLT